MSATGIKAVDASLQKTNTWLKEIGDELELDAREDAWVVLRLGLHALRDQIATEEVFQLAAQLPMLIRGLYFEGWTPRIKPGDQRRTDEFLDSIQKHFDSRGGLDPELAMKAVLGVLTRHISKGEIDDIKAVLPKELRGMWPVTV